ncbi:MAG TPA: glycoside hydrolase family 2 TIM barrel-domain containing protein [Bacteroidales bacterium]|nr:glycoside hydrolase family 2 TIM barrel-domain containing protein [Bacteroidales bacterium]
MRKSFIFTVLIFAASLLSAQETQLATGWKAIKASDLGSDGCLITKADPDLSKWMTATVPGTVLTTLVNNGLMPDPLYGMNNERIPDVYVEGRDFYTYWFYNRFSTEGIDSTKQIWLKFRGINYFAEVYLNGRRISTDKHEGMFLREKYNITPYLNPAGLNRLAVLVEPPANPGDPNGGQGGDGTIGRDVTMQFTAGWDWIQPVRDRNTGIWDQVSIEITGDVDIRDAFAKPRVPGARLPGELQDPAYVTFSAVLVNASDEPAEGEAVLAFGSNVEKKKVKLAPNSSAIITFGEIKQTDPKIWWPNGLGQPSLYSADISFQGKDNIVQDREDMTFGFRETGGYFEEKTGSRVFTINGQKVFIKGGNWIASDAMLRLNPERYDAEVRMHADMNMNMIRIWGGSITERPEFYDACDRYGILVWQDLWITGDCNGRWPDKKKVESQERRREYPDNQSLFIASFADQVKMLRNHPSLYLWCGGNEFPPAPELDARIQTTLKELDGTRQYISESTSSDLVKNTIGGTADGPYLIQDPLWFFTEKGFAFNPETGSVGMPNIEGLKKIMDEKDLVPPAGQEINPVWKYHKYLGYGDMIEKYGPVKDLEDFVLKAQLAGYEQYRSLQEGNNAHMWEWYTGMLVWKSQNPWTALKGQFYDWFLDQNSTFYAYKHAAAPLHMQLNLNDSAIYIVNATPKERKGLRVEAILTDESGKQLWVKSLETSAAPNSILKLWDGEFPVGNTGVSFLRLKITYLSTGVLIDDNTYWIPGIRGQQSLMELGEAKIVAQMMKSSKGKFIVDVANSGDIAAFFVRMKVITAATGELASPVFFDDNYIVLLPGEKRSITVDINSLPPAQKNTPLLIEFKGANLPSTVVRL